MTLKTLLTTPIIKKGLFLLLRLLIVLLALLGVFFILILLIGIGKTTHHGPSSPSGITVEVIVSDDASWNVGSDFFTTVILTADRDDGWFRHVWHDQNGQQSSQGVKQLLQSMRWIEPGIFMFECHNGKSVQIQFQQGLWSM